MITLKKPIELHKFKRAMNGARIVFWAHDDVERVTIFTSVTKDKSHKNMMRYRGVVVRRNGQVSEFEWMGHYTPNIRSGSIIY